MITYISYTYTNGRKKISKENEWRNRHTNKHRGRYTHRHTYTVSKQNNLNLCKPVTTTMIFITKYKEAQEAEETEPPLL